MDEKAAAIKAELVDVLTQFNAAIPPDSDLRQVELAPSGNSHKRYVAAQYLRVLALLSQDYPMVGHYVRYLAPAFSAGVVRVPEDLLKDRFLDHFSRAVATTGLPPVFPPLTLKEIDQVENFMLCPLGPPAWQTTWPYGWAAHWLLGVN